MPWYDMPQILLRIRTKEGTRRIQIDKSASLKDLYQKISENLCINETFFLTSEHGQQIPINSNVNIPFNHGDIINIRYEAVPSPSNSLSAATPSQSTPSLPFADKTFSSNSLIDPLDLYMKGQSGLIKIEKCNLHPSGQQCSSCLPMEPYNKDYLKSKGIKHLSLYSYIKSLGGSLPSDPPIITSSSFSCTRHPPSGRCSSCQSSSVMLNLQSWRMVDHVEIENPKIIDEFLSSGWRRDGYQRFAWLIGYYSSYEGVPLGIKAVITAIITPKQDSSIDGVRLLDPEAMPSNLHSKCQVVGMMYTDLTNDSGKVLYHRNKDSYFISSTECYFMAKQQVKHPTVLPFPSSKTQLTTNWSSRFVTLVLTGNEHGSIDIMAYQVSMMAESLSKMNILEPSSSSSLMCINEKENVDLYYRDTNEYGYEVNKKASPTFPVEYLLVALTHGFPIDGGDDGSNNNSNNSGGDSSPSNLFIHAEILDENIRSVSTYLHKFIHQELLDQLSNYSLLYFISNAFLTEAEAIRLVKSIVERDEKELENFIMSSTGWHTFQELLQAQADIDNDENHVMYDNDGNVNHDDIENSDVEELGWSCPHCTFYNRRRGRRDNREKCCEMCLLPPS